MTKGGLQGDAVKMATEGLKWAQNSYCVWMLLCQYEHSCIHSTNDREMGTPSSYGCSQCLDCSVQEAQREPLGKGPSRFLANLIAPLAVGNFSASAKQT